MSEPEYRYRVTAYNRDTGEQASEVSVGPVGDAIHISWHLDPPLSPWRHPWKWYSIRRRIRKAAAQVGKHYYGPGRTHHRSPR
jgi:hypothetical protein